MKSFKKYLGEKLKASDDMGDWVKDFQGSDAPQFKGKSKEKRRQMAIAAKLDAEREAGMRKEEVELDESFASNMNKAAKKAHADAAEKIKKMGPVTRDTLADINVKLGNTTKNEEVELDEAAPKMKGDWLKKERERNRAHDAAMGRTPTGRKKPVRQMTSTQKSLAKMRGEEVEIDEVLDTPKAMDSYRNKAKASKEKAANSAVAKMFRSKDKDNREHPAAELKTMAKRTAGEQMANRAAARKTRAMLMKKEETELDEAEMSLYDKIKAARKNPSPDKPVRGRGSKNRNPKTYDVRNTLDKEDDRFQDLVKKRLQKKNEEAELDEAKTNIYHKHMLKALGKSRLPKNHSYTSAIANNGDFVVKDGGGRTIGRIPKGEHNLKD